MATAAIPFPARELVRGKVAMAAAILAGGRCSHPSAAKRARRLRCLDGGGMRWRRFVAAVSRWPSPRGLRPQPSARMRVFDGVALGIGVPVHPSYRAALVRRRRIYFHRRGAPSERAGGATLAPRRRRRLAVFATALPPPRRARQLGIATCVFSMPAARSPLRVGPQQVSEPRSHAQRCSTAGIFFGFIPQGGRGQVGSRFSACGQ